MSSSFSILNFAKDQATMDAAKEALNDFMWWGLLWNLGSTLVLGSEHGLKGSLAAVGANTAVLGGIWLKYNAAFEEARVRHGLPEPESATPLSSVAVGAVQSGRWVVL